MDHSNISYLRIWKTFKHLTCEITLWLFSPKTKKNNKQKMSKHRSCKMENMGKEPI